MAWRKKVIRVEIEYEDGSVERATGDDAEQIWRWVEGATIMAWNRGTPYSGPRLQPVEKGK